MLENLPPEKVYAAITEGVRLAMLEHLATAPKNAATAATAPAPVPAPPPPPSAAPAPAPAGGLQRCTVYGSALHGPTASSPHKYASFTMTTPTGGRFMLRFMRNSKTQGEQWDALLGAFIAKCGMTDAAEREELHGCHIELNLKPGLDTAAGLTSVAQALGVLND